MAGAVVVGAAEYFADGLGQGQAHFFHHFKSPDAVDHRLRRKQRQPVGVFFFEVHFLDFNDVFAALRFARQVEAHRYRVAVVQEFELAQDGQAEACGDVVDYGAVFNGFYAESGVFHGCLLNGFV